MWKIWIFASISFNMTNMKITGNYVCGGGAGGAILMEHPVLYRWIINYYYLIVSRNLIVHLLQLLHWSFITVFRTFCYLYRAIQIDFETWNFLRKDLKIWIRPNSKTGNFNIQSDSKCPKMTIKDQFVQVSFFPEKLKGFSLWIIHRRNFKISENIHSNKILKTNLLGNYVYIWVKIIAYSI